MGWALRRGGLWLSLTASAWFAGQAGWIHAKAGVAQWLLERAWEQGQDAGQAPPPWPWADTHPIAKLSAPRLGQMQIVLHGDSGRVLAFGPGWAPASAAPGRRGNIVLSGHRDTHFAWLRELRPGDLLLLDDGRSVRRYRVDSARTADSRREHIALDDAFDRLTLVTCWPFDAVQAGGPMRYVVSASPVESSNATTPSATPAARNLLAHGADDFGVVGRIEDG